MGTTMRAQKNEPTRKISLSRLSSQSIAKIARVTLFLFTAAGISLALHLPLVSAQDPSEQPSPGTESNAAQDSTTDATASKTVEKGGHVDVKTFGATGDGVTDDTAAFNAALDSLAGAGGGTCLVPKGTYIISASGITSHVKSGLHLIGEGKASLLKIAAVPNGPLLWGEGNAWSIERLALDMGDFMPTVRRPAIACRGDNWRVANCSIFRIGFVGISVSGGNNWSIEKNRITKTVPAKILNEAILVTKLGDTRATHARIVGNVCEGSGIMFWGFYSTIARNRVSNAGFGSGIFTGQVANCHNMKIAGNVCTDGRGFDENRTWVSGFELWSPDSIVEGNVAANNDGGGIIIGGKNCVVIANDSYDNGVRLPRGAGFVARYRNEEVSASGSVFIGNRAHNSRYTNKSATQNFGYAEQPGRLHDIVHIGNDYDGNKVRPADYHSAAGQRNVSADQGSAVIQARLSPEMKNRLKALSNDEDLPDNARRAVRQYLAR